MHFIEIWLSPVFTCKRQNIKLSLSHALLYSFIVFKYVILILRKEKYILGRNYLYFWGSGEMLVYFRDLGSKGKILLGSRGNYFQGSVEINALFSGIKGAQTPLGPQLPPSLFTTLICFMVRNDLFTLTSLKPEGHLKINTNVRPSTVSLTHLSRMEFPFLINWTSPISFKGTLGGNLQFYLKLNRTFCKSTVDILIIRRDLDLHCLTGR